MNSLLDKLSSYNLFNYLFPGILFVVITDKISSLHLIQEDIILGVFLYYFIGLIISRVGSLIIEPLLKKISFVTFSDYKDYINASKKDKKIELFSEVNNMYRTLIALFSVILCVKPYELLYLEYPKLTPFATILALMALFLWSYRKQTGYICKRVNNNQV